MAYIFRAILHLTNAIKGASDQWNLFQIPPDYTMILFDRMLVIIFVNIFADRTNFKTVYGNLSVSTGQERGKHPGVICESVCIVHYTDSVKHLVFKEWEQVLHFDSTLHQYYKLVDILTLKHVLFYVSVVCMVTKFWYIPGIFLLMAQTFISYLNFKHVSSIMIQFNIPWPWPLYDDLVL